MLVASTKKKEMPAKDRYLQLLWVGTISDVYNYLYSLPFKQLILLLTVSNTKEYTPLMLKSLVLRDMRQQVNHRHKQLNKRNQK